LSLNQHISLKSLKLTALFLLSPIFIFAQLLTGLWTGVLTNDSTSAQKDQSYEIALTEYRGKVFGYSRTEFIFHDTLYYIVKRVKGVIDGDTCEVKDDDILSYNYPKRPDKKVKVSSFFYRNKKDSSWHLTGKWKTNKTKEYYPITGNVILKEEKDLSASKLFPHLEELNLINDVAFYKEWKEEKNPVVLKQVEPENNTMALNDAATNKLVPKPGLHTNDESEKPTAITEPVYTAKVVTKPPPREETIKKIDGSSTMKEVLVSSTATKKERTETKINPVSPGPRTEINKEVTISSTIPDKEKTEPILTKAVPKQEPEKQKIPVKTTSTPPKKESLTTTTGPTIKNVAVTNVPPVSTAPAKTTTEAKKPEATPAIAQPNAPLVKVNPVSEKTEIKSDPLADLKKLPVAVTERKSEFSQFVNFKSDSLELALYDNGEIDGDTVSIFLNGQVLLSRQGLKATAIKKTIYLTPGKDDEFTLLLFAENLGKYPPNTGLLVVHDGEDVYNVRFSADFQTNAGVVFKRKK
jgi:hypothetical protein